MEFLQSIFAAISQGWANFIKGLADIGPWLATTFPVGTWLESLLKWISEFKLPF